MIFVQQALAGSSMAFFFAPAMSLSLGFVPPAETVGATGLLHFLRTFAMAIATTLTVMSWENGTTAHRVAMVDRLHDSGVLHIMMTTGESMRQALRQFDAMVQTEAVMLSTIDIFYVFAVIMAACGLVI